MDKYEPLVTRETLIKAMKLDDENAWSDFYDRYASLILNFALKRGASRELAEDVLQETAMTLMKYIKTFNYDKGKGSFKSLLFKITESKVIDSFRREGRLTKLKSSELFKQDGMDHKSSEESEKLWEEEWKAAILREALEETKKRVQTRTYKCFDEIFMKGESVKNTAEKMHISPNLVSQHVAYNRQLRGAYYCVYRPG